MGKIKLIYRSIANSEGAGEADLAEILMNFLKFLAVDVGLNEMVVPISALNLYDLPSLYKSVKTWFESKDHVAFTNSFDKVLRLEFRGCESMLDRLDPSSPSSDRAVTLMSEINKYVRSLYLFFEHAKMLTTKQFLQLEPTDSGSVQEILLPRV